MANDPTNTKGLAAPGVVGVVAPMKEGEMLRYSDTERLLFDGYAVEQARISGAPVDYWSINATDTKKDPLYAEPIERVFDGPFRVFGIFLSADQTPVFTEEGLAATFDTSVMLPRKALEDAGVPSPSHGDVVHVWDLPLYIALSTPEAKPLPGAGYYFDVLNANPDGYIIDSPTFVRWNLQLKRRTTFTPERRLKRP